MILTMRLVVEILTGTLFYVHVGSDATIGDLKREIGSQQNLPHDRLILILDTNQSPMNGGDEEDGASLSDDGASLSDCGVKDGSHIYLFFSPVDDASTHHFLYNFDILQG
ncbi:hypothetical protein SLEP1_g24320 [Rubroshorea leprosula]|uniref:Ubiquitin-like domain-containing protein n=1 Tax=Rubroshorea leprosula TaxID=152421 RepID=A0AAV5JRC6_9ROSI|nr:hypothetical protein SLEP1_g24320 [Rubroshorea leprosula]